jgi:hypothetical protein
MRGCAPAHSRQLSALRCLPTSTTLGYGAGQLLSCRVGQILDVDVPRRHGREPEDAATVDSHVRHSDVVAELVLAREAVEKTFKSLVPRFKGRAIVARPEALISIAHEVAEGGRRLSRSTRPKQLLTRLPRHHDAWMDNELRG